MSLKLTNAFIYALALLAACTSSKDPNPNGTTGTNSSITTTAVTGSSDAYVYIDDVLTIKGSGFDTDINKDSVELMVKDEFGVFQTVNYQGSNKYFLNQHATTSELTFKVSDDQLTWFNMNVYGNHTYGFRVRANGMVSNVIAIPVRRIFSFNFTYGSINTPIKVGDPVSIDGRDFTDNCSMKISITRCGKPSFCTVGAYSICDCDNYIEVPCSGWTYKQAVGDGTYYNMVTAFGLSSVFGINTEMCAKDNYYYQTKVKIQNKDGKVAIGYCWIYYRPC